MTAKAAQQWRAGSSMMASRQGVQLSTFLRWETHGVIGYKAEKLGDRDVVTSIWCKTCARHAHKIIPTLRGQAVKDFQKYVSGTTFVSKWTVMRHFESKGHLASLQYEKLLGSSFSQSDSATSDNNNNNSGTQPRIDSSIQNAAKNAYRKLIRTSYILAARGKPLSGFKTAVEIQKANGLQLISGADDGRRANEMVKDIALSVKNKVVNLIQESSFFAVLSDGSQARKTNSEKELILVRIVRNGRPLYLAVALENIDDYGNATADNIKKSLDDVFQNVNKIQVSEETYKKRLVSATADGASVNTGIYNGVLTQLKRERPWLVTTHCVSHRLELAIKDSLMNFEQFKSIKDFMVSLYYYSKKASKFVRHMHSTAEALGTQAYKFPKVHGTRFLNHTRRGINTLLHNWPILLQSIENTLASQAKQDPKLIGYLKKLKSFTFLSQCCLYQQLVEKLALLSLTFEKQDLLVFEIRPAVRHTVEELQDMLSQNTLSEENSGFTLSEDNLNVLTCNRHKAGHKRRKVQNQENVTLTFSGMTHTSETIGPAIETLKSKSVSKIIECLEGRFVSFDSHLFQNCQWLDPANWHTEEVAEELKAIQTVADHFKVPLESRSFDSSSNILKKEWKYIKHVVDSYYQGFKPKEVWVRILGHRRQKCPNICLLVDLLFCLGMSNSSVEGGFSHLTAMLPDSRLSTAHRTMENLLLIKVNNLSWTVPEREQIIESALDLYMTKRRKRKLHTDDLLNDEPERTAVTADAPDSSTDSESTSSSDENFETDMETDMDITSETDIATVSDDSEPDSEELMH